MKFYIYLKSGQVITLREVESLEFTPGRSFHVKAFDKARVWAKHIDPEQIVAILQED